jgi:CheY-like chemotaxis protein
MQQKFDLVMTDYNVGGMTGIDLCNRLRSEGYADTPFILASGSKIAESDEQLKGMKLAAILKKPFSMSDLKSTVEHCLSGRPVKTW